MAKNSTGRITWLPLILKVGESNVDRVTHCLVSLAALNLIQEIVGEPDANRNTGPCMIYFQIQCDTDKTSPEPLGAAER